MKTQQATNETLERAKQLGRETEDVLLMSLHAELASVHTLCMLAKQEIGEKRSHHVEQATRVLETIFELVKHVRVGKEDRDAIEQARRDVVQLGGQEPSTVKSG